MKTAVFLLNMGGPDSMGAIAPFLENLFSDPAIMRFPGAWLVRRPLARFISKKRALKVARHYEKMGGKSPLPALTDEQAKALAAELGPDYSVHVAMRYWHPFAGEAVAEAKKAGAERIVILPLYPHYCSATTGSSLLDLEKSLKEGGLSTLPSRTVKSFETYPPYVDALAGAVEEAAKLMPDAFFLFSAHGVPVKLIEEGDPYLDHVTATVAAVMEKFPGRQHLLAFQSRTGPVKWLSPSTEDALETLARGGVKKLLVVAVSFVSDHIETLCEIDEQYRDEAAGLGITGFARAPSLNSRPDFISALAGLVRREVSGF